MGEWKNTLWANLKTEKVQLTFKRYYNDITDPMSDDPRTTWTATNRFKITLSKLQVTYINTTSATSEYASIITTGTKTKYCETFTQEIYSKELANKIWYMAKHNASYEQIKNLLNQRRM